MQVDHFGDHRGTFPQRLCIYDKWWRNATASPLAPAVVAGGEGGICALPWQTLVVFEGVYVAIPSLEADGMLNSPKVESYELRVG